MSACQHFKQAFLQQCVLAWLPDRDARGRQCVLAGLLEPTAKQAFDGLGLYVGLPAAAGVAGGYGVAKLQELIGQDEDPDELESRNDRRLALRRRANPVRAYLSSGREQMPPSRPLLR